MKLNKISLISLLLLIIVVVGTAITTNGCKEKEDEPCLVENIDIKYTYNVPQDIFKYVEITAAFNNQECNDALNVPMLDDVFTYEYHSKIPRQFPMIFIYDRTNRPARGIEVHYGLTMDVEVWITVNGENKYYSRQYIYKFDGDLEDAIYRLRKDIRNSTYNVTVKRDGNVLFFPTTL